MIDFACGVIRISNKCSWLKIIDQQGNLNPPFVVIPYPLALEFSIELIPYQYIFNKMNYIFI